MKKLFFSVVFLFATIARASAAEEMEDYGIVGNIIAGILALIFSFYLYRWLYFSFLQPYFDWWFRNLLKPLVGLYVSIFKLIARAGAGLYKLVAGLFEPKNPAQTTKQTQTVSVPTPKPAQQPVTAQPPPAAKPYMSNPVESKSPQHAKQLDYAAKGLWLGYETIEETEFWQDYEALLAQVKDNT